MIDYHFQNEGQILNLLDVMQHNIIKKIVYNWLENRTKVMIVSLFFVIGAFNHSCKYLFSNRII